MGNSFGQKKRSGYRCVWGRGSREEEKSGLTKTNESGTPAADGRVAGSAAGRWLRGSAWASLGENKSVMRKFSSAR
jgi:hypothetical protein